MKQVHVELPDSPDCLESPKQENFLPTNLNIKQSDDHHSGVQQVTHYMISMIGEMWYVLGTMCIT